MTAQRIVFIRHGKPKIIEGVPSAQWRLSDEGRSAVAALAEHFRDYDFSAIATSPEPKAVGTAEAIASQLNLPIETDPGLAEHARHSAGYLSRDDLEAGIARLFASTSEPVFGDETADQAFARFAAALERRQAKGARDILVVTHGTILSIYLGRVAGIDPLPFWRTLPTPAAIVLEDGKIRMVPTRLG
jgi:broad specificity phosphatase PhoE